MEKVDLITMGEAVIELSSDKDFKDTTTFDKFYGGDAIVTAITASRFGVNTGYITCVGDDPFKDFFLNEWKKENDKRNSYQFDYKADTIIYTSEDLKDIENCFSRILYIFETSERKLKYEEIIKTIKMSTL